MSDIPQYWRPFIRYILKAMTIIGGLSAGVFIAGFSHPSPWVSFATGILILLTVFAILSYINDMQPHLFILPQILMLVSIPLVLLSNLGSDNIPEVATAAFLSGGSLAALIVVLKHRWQFIVMAITTLSIVILFVIVLWDQPITLITYLPLTITSWVGAGIIRRWLQSAIFEHEILLKDVETAVQTGLEATEREAQRRYSARQLHDTVLSTLTMLAHSGKGIDPDALKAQAASDAEFLGSLRKGHNPRPQHSMDYALEAIPEAELSQTFESVRSRFQSSGLRVNWMGEGKLLMPRHRVDTLIAAISECLENVRRHSTAPEAFVTVSVEPKVVRVIISDQGKGFDQRMTSGGLGLKHSVIARIEEIGGNVSIFSEPGVGTTVVLEAPVE